MEDGLSGADLLFLKLLLLHELVLLLLGKLLLLLHLLGPLLGLLLLVRNMWSLRLASTLAFAAISFSYLMFSGRMIVYWGSPVTDPTAGTTCQTVSPFDESYARAHACVCSPLLRRAHLHLTCLRACTLVSRRVLAWWHCRLDLVPASKCPIDYC